jgi:tetratricopeptide (TPR) repeat protein
MATKVRTSMTPLRTPSSVDIETFGSTVLTWLQENRARLLGFLGVVVLIIGGMLYVEYRKQVVLSYLREGIVELQRGEGEKAIPLLENVRGARVVEAETQAIGLLYLGEAYAKRERKEEAKKAYEEALAVAKSGRESAQYLQQIILLKLGQEAELRREQTQARQWYEQAAAIEEGPLQSEALAQAGESLEKANDQKAAAMYYERLLTKDERYPLAEVFRERVGK